MDCLDVNVLVNAHRTDAVNHRAYADFVLGLLRGDQAFAIPSVVLSSFLRVVTHARIFSPPSSIDDALVFTEQFRASPQCMIVAPGSRHLEIFIRLCRMGNARGPLVSDAYIAATAIEIGAELVTADRGFGRWPGLRWRYPLDD